MVIGRDQEPGGPGGGVIDRLADARVDELDDGADDMARRAELAKLARLFRLAQDMLEKIALGVGVDRLKPQVVHLGDDLAENRGLVDGQARPVQEVRDAVARNLCVEGEDLVADPHDEAIAVERVRP